MQRLTKAVFVVKIYFKTKSYIQAVFQHQFRKTQPVKRTILSNVKKTCSYGTNLNRNKENAGWPRTNRPDNIMIVPKKNEKN